MIRFLRVTAFLLYLPGHLAAAATVPVPEPLQPWVDWVLHGMAETRCPVLYNQATRHRCAWPSALEVDLAAKRGTFAQRWTVDAESWLSLPGDRSHWPRQVYMDGLPALVLERDGRPVVKAQPGEHTVTGTFSWPATPESLALPRDTGLLNLMVQGRSVTNPLIDDDGTLWLQKRAQPGQADQLTLRVFRLVTDAIPLQLATRLVLKVAGQAREISLGRVLPQGFIPLALESPLPSRLEPDGRLRLQVKPGEWLIELSARYPGPIDAITLPEPEVVLVDEEIWSFKAVNALRLVQVEGAPSLDPRSTNLPDAWRQLPAYLMEPGQTLRLITRKRGDPEPVSDRLNLEKTLWLDFDGVGYTVQDRLEGTVSHSARLETVPEVALGRVSVNGQDQFVTRLPDSAADGIEVRQGQIALTADSRLESGDIGDLPAVGWQVSPLSHRAVLNLPPGWRLLNVSGADSTSNVWLYRWNLLDLFIVLIIALSFGRLWGWPAGLLALVGLVLFYHEPNAPRLIWLNLLAAVALLRVLPPGRLRTLISVYRQASVLILLVISLVFSVQQVRGGLYPQLTSLPLVPPILTDTAPPPSESVSDVPGKVSSRNEPDRIAPVPESPQSDFRRQYAADVKVQTGPGLPSWRWQQVVLDWSGPVVPEQRLRLSLLPPWATRLLMFAGVALLLAMLVRALEPGRPIRHPKGAFALLLWLPVLWVSLPSGALAELPSPSLLRELRTRLTEPPDCNPACAALTALSLRAQNDELKLVLDLHSQVDTAVPLPLPRRGLMPAWVRRGQEPVPLYRDAGGMLWARVPAGLHQLEIRVVLPKALTTLQLPLPMRPGWAEVAADGWLAEGVYAGVAETQIQLTRQQTSEAALQPGMMPPFVQVERELVLGIDWQVNTRVRRLSQADSAAVLAIPLLDGEHVTTSGVRVRDGRVMLSIPLDEAEIQWWSTLEKSQQIRLQAADTTDYVETWRLRTEPLWHVETAGIAVIHRYGQAGEWLPQWRPWPGESVVLSISRPQGVPGKTVTIDESRLRVSPGRRATETSLELVIRSSRGTDHTVTLPDGAELTGVSINGQSQPVKQSGRAVVLALVPETQRVRLSWTRDVGVSHYTVTPEVDLGADSVDSHITLVMPQNRWSLLVGGPRLGPAVLFWGVLVVIALGALALGRFGGTPLKAWQWLFLGVGLSQAHVVTILLVVGWLLLLKRRQDLADSLGNLPFNALQVLVILLTLASLAALLGAIEQGLLGSPAMQIVGNGSSAHELRWYQDRSPGLLPQAWAVSVPLLVYRALMLIWALWLALALLGWLRWAWSCFSSGGIWRRLRLKKA